MDYPYYVRRALTEPSGRLKEGVSSEAYEKFIREAYKAEEEGVKNAERTDEGYIYKSAVNWASMHKEGKRGNL